jgi:YD repeat-containing protein
MLDNGLYELALECSAADGSTLTAADLYLVTNLKIGAFTLTFEDMVIPVISMPFSALRTYDSRKRESQGDFGFGWAFSTADVTLTKSHELGSGWIQSTSGGAMPTYTVSEAESHDIVIKYPDGGIDWFKVGLNPQSQALSPIQYSDIVFVAQPGTKSSLEFIGSPQYMFYAHLGESYIYDSGSMDVFDWNQFVLTTKEGAKYRFNDGKAFEIEDTHGGKIEISSQGIVHSDGMGVSVERDFLGRVESVTSGSSTASYAYDPYLDLVAVTDPGNAVTRLIYDSEHNIVEILDPRGVKATHADK